MVILCNDFDSHYTALELPSDKGDVNAEDNNLSITIKMHCVFCHLIPCLRNIGWKGLGTMSAQANEACHREFKLFFWDKYKVRYLKKQIVENMSFLGMY